MKAADVDTLPCIDSEAAAAVMARWHLCQRGFGSGVISPCSSCCVHGENMVK